MKNIYLIPTKFNFNFFKQLNFNDINERTLIYKSKNGIFYLYIGVNKTRRSSWRKMKKIQENKNFIGWFAPTDKISRYIKIMIINDNY